jgi:hypothetical protein
VRRCARVGILGRETQSRRLVTEDAFLGGTDPRAGRRDKEIRRRSGSP